MIVICQSSNVLATNRQCETSIIHKMMTIVKQYWNNMRIIHSHWIIIPYRSLQISAPTVYCHMNNLHRLLKFIHGLCKFSNNLKRWASNLWAPRPKYEASFQAIAKRCKFRLIQRCYKNIYQTLFPNGVQTQTRVVLMCWKVRMPLTYDKESFEKVNAWILPMILQKV
jgi:hypothetical protein